VFEFAPEQFVRSVEVTAAQHQGRPSIGLEVQRALFRMQGVRSNRGWDTNPRAMIVELNGSDYSPRMRKVTQR
jgi:hypothetical protein